MWNSKYSEKYVSTSMLILTFGFVKAYEKKCIFFLTDVNYIESYEKLWNIQWYIIWGTFLLNHYIAGFIFKRVSQKCFSLNSTVWLASLSVVNNLKDCCVLSQSISCYSPDPSPCPPFLWKFALRVIISSWYYGVHGGGESLSSFVN